ncbi:MAG: glycosyl hydrolase, partial [Gemmatimonadota bacterium]
PALDKLRFRDIGPATPSGRVDDLAVYEGNPAVFYIATATGGLWKTVNNGTTLEQVFHSQTTSSIGDVAIAPNDPNLVWVGTGENNNRQSSSWGDGVYKSADGGRTWVNMGLKDSKQIARIIVDPVDYDVVYVAALGNLWAGGGDRGVYKTTDGGVTWARILEAGPFAGATELVMDPANNKVLYAATYQRLRSSWGFNGGGDASAIYKTTDAGRTWTKLTKGIPAGPLGRIGLDIYRKNPNVLYARIEHQTESGTYRSDDAGASWTKLSNVNPRPMYFSQIRVDPQTDSRIYVLGVQLHVSDDGGRTFHNEGARQIHVDFHAMWVNPKNPDHLILGGDGGVGISYDRSKTYVWLNNLPVGQFYHVAFDNQFPYTVCGGLQDNNTWCGPSAVRNEWGIGNDEWFIIGGGDGFVGMVDPTNPRVMYAESQNGNMNRIDRLTNERTSIRPEPTTGERAYRWNWDTPLILSPHDGNTVYAASNRVFKSSDRGHTWRAISPDLTLQLDRDTLELMGVKGRDIRLAANDGVSSFGTLSTVHESPVRRGVIWTGSDDGQLHVTRDDGGSWTNVTSKLPGVPKWTYISRVEPSRTAEGTVYVTLDGHRLGDFATYVFTSSDFGGTWSSVAGDLPKGEVARTITEDLKNPDVLYLGTESGLWFTYDRGKHWLPIKGRFPTVPVYEIAVHPRENAMIVATHGRALWILDDLSPFQEYARAVASNGHLFSSPGIAWRRASSERMRDFEGDMKYLGKNPERGAVLHYWLPAAGNGATLTIADASGQTIRELKSDSTGKPQAGFNALGWDLRVEPNRAPRLGNVGGGGGGFFGGGTDGPIVLPGTYTARLTVDGRAVGSTTIAVRPDPEITIADADRKAWFDLQMELHRLQAQANEIAEKLVQANEQLSAARERMRDTTKVSAAERASWREFVTQFDSSRRAFGVAGGGGFGGPPNMRTLANGLKGQVMQVTALPTATQVRRIDALRVDLPKAIAEANAVLGRVSEIRRSVTAGGS